MVVRREQWHSQDDGVDWHGKRKMGYVAIASHTALSDGQICKADAVTRCCRDVSQWAMTAPESEHWPRHGDSFVPST